MKTSKQIEILFRKDLKLLLDKYKAEIELVEVGGAYLEVSKISIFIPTKYNASGEMVDEYTDFFL